MSGGEFVSIGEFLRSCRERMNMKQAELAHILNINQSDVSKIERGDKEPLISLFRDWTLKTNSVDLGVAFLYGSVEVAVNTQNIIEAVGSMIAGFIWIGGLL